MLPQKKLKSFDRAMLVFGAALGASVPAGISMLVFSGLELGILGNPVHLADISAVAFSTWATGMLMQLSIFRGKPSRSTSANSRPNSTPGSTQARRSSANVAELDVAPELDYLQFAIRNQRIQGTARSSKWPRTLVVTITDASDSQANLTFYLTEC